MKCIIIIRWKLNMKIWFKEIINKELYKNILSNKGLKFIQKKSWNENNDEDRMWYSKRSCILVRRKKC